MPENLPDDYSERYPGPKGIPIEAIIDFRQRGLSIPQIAKLTGLNTRTASRRIKAASDLIDTTKKYVNNRALILAYEQNRIRHHLTDAKLLKASARDLVVSYGILYDKERLETGQSTQNIAYADMVQARDQARQARLALEADTV